jgi:hypothetical protein
VRSLTVLGLGKESADETEPGTGYILEISRVEMGCTEVFISSETAVEDKPGIV